MSIDILDVSGAAEALIPKIDPSRHPLAIEALLEVLKSVVGEGSDAAAIGVLLSRRLLARLIALASGAPALQVRTAALDFMVMCLLNADIDAVDANAADVRSALSALALQLRPLDANLAMVDKVIGMLRTLYVRWKPVGRFGEARGGDRRAWLAPTLPLVCILPQNLGMRSDYAEFDAIIAHVAANAKALAHDLATLAALDHNFRVELLRGLDDGMGSKVAEESLLAPLVPVLRVATSVGASQQLRELDRIATSSSLRCLAAMAMERDERAVATLIALPLFFDIMREASSSSTLAMRGGGLDARDHAVTVRDMYFRLVERLDRCQASMWNAIAGRGWRGLLVCRHMLERTLAADVDDPQARSVAAMAARVITQVCAHDVEASRVAVEAQLVPLLVDSVRRGSSASVESCVAALTAIATLACCVEARQALLAELPLLLPLLNDGGAVGSEACMVIAQLCLHEERTLWLTLSRFGGFRAARVIVDSLAREVATVPPPPLYPGEFHDHLAESTAIGQLLPDVAMVAEWCCDRSEVLLETKFPEMKLGTAAGALESIVEELRSVYTVVDHDIIARLSRFDKTSGHLLSRLDSDAGEWPQVSEQIESTTSVLRNMSTSVEVTPAQKREMLARHMSSRSASAARSPARTAASALSRWCAAAEQQGRLTRSTDAMPPTPPPRPPSMRRFAEESASRSPSTPRGGQSVQQAVQAAEETARTQRAWAAAAAAEEEAERLAQGLRAPPPDTRYASLIAASRGGGRGRASRDASPYNYSQYAAAATSSSSSSMWDDLDQSTRTAGVTVLNRRQLGPTAAPGSTSTSTSETGPQVHVNRHGSVSISLGGGAQRFTQRLAGQTPSPRSSRNAASPLFSGRSPAKKAMLPW